MLPSKFITSIIILLILTGCGTLSNDSTMTSNEQDKTTDISIEKFELMPATVLRVVDGDTVKIRIDGKEESIRLLLVDTPETKHPDLPVQQFGPEASDFAIEKLSGEKVQIEFDGPTRDHYDRLLGYIWIDGVNFNQLLLEEGLARYAYEYDPPYTHQQEMKQAEKEARQEGIGIWSIDWYVTEEGFEIEPNSNKEVIFSNCTEAQKAGVTPLHQGDPGYGVHMDGDDDGVACE